MPRFNNFDILRLLFAWIVVFTHCYDLSLSPAFLKLLFLMQSERAVFGFFAISGCLIVASWDRARSARDYFSRRAKRILPAYWLAILFCLIMGSLFTSLPLHTFWMNAATWKYIFWNLLFLNFVHPSLPGVFSNNPYAVMDGALWTIKLEVGFYLLVPILIYCVRRFGRGLTLSSVFVASVVYRMVLMHMGRVTLAQQLPGQLCFFIAGTAVYYYFPQFLAHRKKVWLIVLPLLVAAFLTNWVILDAIAIPLFTMAIAFLLPAYRGITHYGDFSYGTYVLHFPIVQGIIAVGLFARSPWLAFTVVVGVVSVAAVASWFGVERRFLQAARVRQQESEAKGQIAV